MKSVPILESLKTWIEKVLSTTLPKSPIRQGLQYILRHWTALNRNTTEDYLSIDSNAAERGFRPIGFGGKTAATLFTVTQTCREFGINTWDYLKTRSNSYQPCRQTKSETCYLENNTPNGNCISRFSAAC